MYYQMNNTKTVLSTMSNMSNYCVKTHADEILEIILGEL